MKCQHNRDPVRKATSEREETRALPVIPTMATETTKRRSGISVDRALRIQAKLKNRVSELYSLARSFHLTHDELLERRKAILESTEWQKAPYWATSYVRGYEECLRDTLYRHELEWRMWVDGRLLTRGEIDAIQATEPIKCENSVWSRIDSEKSRHCWKGRPDKPF